MSHITRPCKETSAMPLGLITGASKGFGRAVARELAAQGWDLVVDARDAGALHDAYLDTTVTTLAGDVTDPLHRASLARAIGDRSLDLLVNNASRLGPSPQPRLATYDLDELRRVYDTNVVAPLALVQLLLPALQSSAAATVVNVTSDASVEAYDGWGGYGASKAALDQLSAVLAPENRDPRVYAFDPRDMRTPMPPAAFPRADISHPPGPEAVAAAPPAPIERR